MLGSGKHTINDNPTSEPGLTKINAQQWSSQTSARTGTVYGHIEAEYRQEILNKEPVWTWVDSAGGNCAYANATLIKVFSCLNMLGGKGESFGSIKRKLRFVGFAAGEPPHQGMHNSKNGTLPVYLAGFMTIIHTGTDNIPAASWVGMRPPNPKLVAQSWTDRKAEKVVGETYAWEPTIGDASRHRGYMLLHRIIMGDNVKDEVDDDNELQGYVEWWRNERTKAFVSAVEFARASGAPANLDEQTVVAMARMYGVIAPLDNEMLPATQFQLRLLKRLFVMNTRDDKEAYFDPDQLYFPLSMAGHMVQDKNKQEIAQAQNTAVPNSMNSIVAIHDVSRSEIIGWAPVGGLPMEPMDIHLRAPII